MDGIIGISMANEAKVSHRLKDPRGGDNPPPHPLFDSITELVAMCFPDMKGDIIGKISQGKRFEGWSIVSVKGQVEEKVVGCAAVFCRKNRFNFGVFCTHPQYRGKGYGRLLYMSLVNVYGRLVWNVTDSSVLNFYTRLGGYIFRTDTKIRRSDSGENVVNKTYWMTNVYERVIRSAPVVRGQAPPSQDERKRDEGRRDDRRGDDRRGDDRRGDEGRRDDRREDTKTIHQSRFTSYRGQASYRGQSSYRGHGFYRGQKYKVYPRRPYCPNEITSRGTGNSLSGPDMPMSSIFPPRISPPPLRISRTCSMASSRSPTGPSSSL